MCCVMHLVKICSGVQCVFIEVFVSLLSTNTSTNIAYAPFYNLWYKSHLWSDAAPSVVVYVFVSEDLPHLNYVFVSCCFQHSSLAKLF